MSNTATISQELGEMNQKCIELLGQVQQEKSLKNEIS